MTSGRNKGVKGAFVAVVLSDVEFVILSQLYRNYIATISQHSAIHAVNVRLQTLPPKVQPLHYQ